jgi:hypothetical protein
MCYVNLAHLRVPPVANPAGRRRVGLRRDYSHGKPNHNVLVTISISRYREKARWALDPAGVHALRMFDTERHR